MRGNVFFHRLDIYPLCLPAFIPTTTAMAFSVVEDIMAPNIPRRIEVTVTDMVILRRSTPGPRHGRWRRKSA
jgi:hypothetical protein